MITDQILTQYALPIFMSLLVVMMILIITSLGKKHGGSKILFTSLAGGLIGFFMIFVVQTTLLEVV